MKVSAFISLGLLLALAAPALADDDGFVSLFNGKNLDGWTQNGGTAKYTIEGDEIVGTSVPKTGNSFLCTDKNYANFILELDFKVDPKLNSGIQFRSNVYDMPVVYEFIGKDGKKDSVKVAAGRVHGYQMEIDPSDRAWSGGIYDEGRRGWLYDLKGDDHKEARQAFQNGEWNHYRIEAVGPVIKTWVNGVPVADLRDSLTPTGFIALQVHGIGGDESKVGKQIRWKNIKIKELPATAQADRPQWLEYPGQDGPGQGKKIVLISGDEEYRSEQALPQLAAILSQQHGFDCTVLFAIDPQTGYVNPTEMHNIPGLKALDSADLMILFTRFRALPDDQMEHIDQYLKSGKPVLGIRTATHAFNFPAGSRWEQYSNAYQGPLEAWADGFGRLVLGEKWHTHHGKHKHQSTRGHIAPGAKESPIVRGIEDGEIWGSTDVYGVRLPLPGDARPIVLGEVTQREGEFDESDRFYGMRESDSKPAQGDLNDPMMPIVWTKSYQLPDGQPGQSITSTIGAAVDLLDPEVRKVLVNSVYVLLDMADKLPKDGASVKLVGDYQPDAYGFRDSAYWQAKKKTVDDFR